MNSIYFAHLRIDVLQFARDNGTGTYQSKDGNTLLKIEKKDGIYLASLTVDHLTNNFTYSGAEVEGMVDYAC